MGYIEKIVKTAIQSLTADELKSLLSPEQLKALSTRPMQDSYVAYWDREDANVLDKTIQDLIEFQYEALMLESLGINRIEAEFDAEDFSQAWLEKALGTTALEEALMGRVRDMDLPEFLNHQNTSFEEVLENNEDEVFDWVTYNYSLLDLLEGKGFSDELADYVRDECCPQDFWSNDQLLLAVAKNMDFRTAVIELMDCYPDLNEKEDNVAK